jgi:hypothetical protein
MTNACNNCHRTPLETELIPAAIVKSKHRKLYYNLKTVTLAVTVSLCSDCKKCLLSDKKPNATTYWPAMLWAFLTSEPLSQNITHLTLEGKWAYLPCE